MTSVTIGSPQLHIEDGDVVGRRWRTGVLLLILADLSFVAALTFAYFYLRGLNTSHAWLKPGQHTAAIWVGAVVAAILVASAVTFRWGQVGIVAGRQGQFVAGTTSALALLVGGIVVQAAQLATFPFGIADSAYSSAVYTMAGANLFHLLLTAFLGAAMVNRGRLGLYDAGNNWQVRLVGTWWSWVALAAVGSAVATSFIASPNV